MSLSDRAVEHLRSLAAEPARAERYELLEPIGQGGMGVVYRARDTLLDRDVALKMLPGRSPELVRRLDREARILARLEHPGIVAVHDVGATADGRLYYVMQLVRGERLDVHAERITALPELLRLVERIGETVAYANAHGIVHRDLKPENVMVGAFGEVLVLDWGVAKVLLGGGAADGFGADGCAADGTGGGPRAPVAAGITADGTVIGTPGFMAPEQALGQSSRVDERTDVFGLGALLAALLAGRSGVPRAVRAICRRAMAHEPAERYPGADALVADLRRWLNGEPVLAAPERLADRAERIWRNYRTAILLVLAYLTMRLIVLLFRGF